MNRIELEKYIENTYPCIKTYPWKSYPDYAVFRHKNKKGFAFILNVNQQKLGLKGEEKADIVNLKCSPVMIGSLLAEEGIFPAYHMNKEHWVSVVLNDSVPDDELKFLLDISFNLTSEKKKPLRN